MEMLPEAPPRPRVLAGDGTASYVVGDRVQVLNFRGKPTGAVVALRASGYDVRLDHSGIVWPLTAAVLVAASPAPALMPAPPLVEMQPAPPLEPPDDAPPFAPPDDDDDEKERSIVDDDDDERSLLSGDSTIEYDSGDETAPYLGEGGARTTSSRFWGVTWYRKYKKWRAYYYDADGKKRSVGYFDDEEEAARAVNKAIRDAGLQGKRRMNAVDATGVLVPKPRLCDRSAVVAPDTGHDPKAKTSKFWGVSWDKNARRWKAKYTDANGKTRTIGYFDTQEQAAHAVNAAIRRAGLEGRRKTNPVVDGQLVPRTYKTKKRRRDEPAATPSPRARRR